MSDETFDFCVEGLDGWAATVSDWRERAGLWEHLAEHCTEHAKGLREDHHDELGDAWMQEWEQ